MKNWKVLFTLIIALATTGLRAQFQYLYQTGEVISYNSNDKIFFGSASSISTDGKILLVGAPNYNGGDGLATILTFNGATFDNTNIQLVGSDATFNSKQGTSVALSADGKTALVGGYNDNSNIGAAWIYTFDGITFSQVGTKLIASDAEKFPYFGISVALSADGKTAVIGGSNDNKGVGATWVFTFNGTAFVQAGSKLIGTDYYKEPNQGVAVNISGDGKTIISGGNNDNNGFGAAWIFSWNGSQYVQVGTKLPISDYSGLPKFGSSVLLSSNGDKAFVSGPADNSNTGAVWVFQKTGDAYIQLNSKLVATSSVTGNNLQGTSMALTPDAKTLVVSAIGDYSYQGSANVFTLFGSEYAQAGERLWNFKVGLARVGSSVALSGDGKTIVLGCSYYKQSTGGLLLFSSTTPIFKISEDTLLFNNDCSGKCIQSITVTSNLPYYRFYGLPSFIAPNYSAAGGTTVIDFINTYKNPYPDSLGYDVSLILGVDTSLEWGTLKLFLMQNGTLTGINDFENADDIQIYPNPNKGSFYLNFNDNYRSIYKEGILFNIYGQAVQKIPLSLPSRKNIPVYIDTPPGLYLLKIGRVTKKILLE